MIANSLESYKAILRHVTQDQFQYVLQRNKSKSQIAGWQLSKIIRPVRINQTNFFKSKIEH